MSEPRDSPTSETKSTSAGGDVIDLPVALERLDNDRELLGELADMFYEDGPEALDRFVRSLEAGDFAEATRAVHSLKGLFRTFEASAAETAAEAESRANAKDATVAELGPVLRRRLDETIAVLREQLTAAS